MKTLMLTTAIATATALGAQAQTVAPGTVPAFLAGDVIGQSLYTLDTMDPDALRADGAVTTGEESVSLADEPGARWTSSEAFLAERDAWQRIGAVDDIVMTMDGEIRGVLVDIGGLLGFGARTVMVEMDDLYFVADDPEAEAIDDTTLLLAMTQDELDALPEWDDAMLRDGFAVQSGAGTAQPEAAPEPMDSTTDTAAAEPGEVIDDAFNVLDGAERTADLLIGADAFDISGDRVGTVEDVVVEVDNSISGLVIEVGGILGLGAHSVHVPLDDTEVGWRPSEEDVEVRVQVPMTVEELQALPEQPG